MIQNSWRGYYLVNNIPFYDKFLALVFANQNKIPIKNISWYYHDAVFNAINWKINPSHTLEELYKIRATQLREKYDYIILFCSGGADSTNMLYSFLKNGIRIDEVVASAPMSGLRDWIDNDQDTSALNTISETNLAQIPLLNQIKNLDSSVRITLNDYFHDILSYEDTKWMFDSSDYIHPTAVARFSLEKFSHLKKLADNGKKIGVIYGIDKPYIFIKDNKIYSAFMDYAVNAAMQSVKHPSVSIELFYYAPELPEITIKQSHIVARSIFLKENIKPLKLTLLNENIYPTPTWNNGPYQRSIVPFIYPLLERQVFQAEKHTSIFFGQHDYWFYSKHNKIKVFEMITSNFKSFFEKFDKQYLQEIPFYDVNKILRTKTIGFKRFIKSYELGNIENFKGKK